MSAKSNNFWLDDPEWEALRRRTENQSIKKQKQPSAKIAAAKLKATREAVIKDAPKVEVSVNLSLPQIQLPQLTPKQIRWVAISVPVVLLVVGATVLIPKLISGGPKDTPGVLAASDVQPDFKTILPNGKQAEINNGKLGYDSQRKVASFTDTIGKIPITVSQQPLPEAFKTDTDARVEKMAKNFNAKEVITASNPRAYLGTSIKGPQTVIFHKEGILVFITSATQIEKDQWAEYITRLY